MHKAIRDPICDCLSMRIFVVPVAVAVASAASEPNFSCAFLRGERPPQHPRGVERKRRRRRRTSAASNRSGRRRRRRPRRTASPASTNNITTAPPTKAYSDLCRCPLATLLLAWHSCHSLLLLVADGRFRHFLSLRQRRRSSIGRIAAATFFFTALTHDGHAGGRASCGGSSARRE
jgi:hypothetical protein